MNTAPKKHIVFLSYYFPPMAGGGVQRILKFLKFWDYESYHVTVITVKPSYFYAEDEFLLREIPGQVNIVRTGSLDPFRVIFILKKLFRRTEAKNNGSRRESGEFIRKIAGFLFIPDSRLLWLPFALNRIRKLHKKNPVDLIIGTVPPFTAGMAAAFANMLFHIPCVLDFRDAWTHNPYLPEISPFHSRLQSCLENFTLRRSAGVIFVNPKLEKYYLDRYPVLVSREIVTIRNGYDPEDFINKSEARSDANPGIFRIGIMGTVYSQGNAPMPLLRAVAEMKKDDPTLSKRLQLVFIGKWANNFIQEIRQFNIDELIDWVSYLPHREALKLALQMDAQALAVQSGLPGSKNVTPGRIYEYLYLKKPILAMCPPNSDLADLVSECRAGEFVEYDDIPRVRGILNDWLKSTDKLTSRYEFKNLQDFHRKQLAKQLLAFLSSFK